MTAEGFLKMIKLRSSHCEQQFPTEESSSGTVIVGWDSWGRPERLLHVLWLRPYPASFLIDRGTILHFLSGLHLSPQLQMFRLWEGRSNYTKGLISHHVKLWS